MYLRNAFVTEDKKMNGMGTKDKKLSGVVSISRGETHQPTHNNKKKAGEWQDYKAQSKQTADNTVRGKGQTRQEIGLGAMSHLCQSNTQQSNRKMGERQTTP